MEQRVQIIFDRKIQSDKSFGIILELIVTKNILLKFVTSNFV